MTPSRRTAACAAALLTGLALVAAACGSSDDASTTATTAAGSTASSSPSTSSPTTGGQTVTIPLEVQATSSGARVVVQASFGGGPTVPMLLDTGSSGVVVASSALGPSAQAGTQSAQIPFVGTTVDGTVATTTVTMGELTTTSAITVVSAQSASCGTDSGTPSSCSLQTALGADVQGVIGIGLSDGPSPATPDYSPLLQVGAPYDEGFVVQLPASGSGAGSLVVGPVSAPSAAVAVPLVASTEPTYPNGAKAFAKDVQLCWAVGSATGCGPTDLDIGAEDTVLTPSDIDGLPLTDGLVTSGTPVSVTVGQGGPKVWGFTAGTTHSDDKIVTSDDLGSATSFNTGVAFFFANVVGYDTANGRLLVWPQSTASSGSPV